MQQSRYTQFSGTNLWTEISYTGPSSLEDITPMFLASGGPGFEDYLFPVAKMVHDILPVIRFDQRGCGKSDNSPPFDFLTVLEDIDQIRKQYGYRKIIVGGHSWGATVALGYALRYQSMVKALFYLAGIGVQNDRRWYEEFQKNKTTFPDPMPDMYSPMNETVNSVGNNSWWNYIKHPNLLKNLSNLNVPTYIIQGEKDVRPNWPTKQLASLLPNAKYVEINDAVHCLWLTHPDELQAELRSCLLDMNQYDHQN